MTFPSQTWTANQRGTETDFDNMTARDDDNKARIEDHTHDGTDALELTEATATSRGVQVMAWRISGNISASSSGRVYWTDDGTSAGTDLFDSSYRPAVMVYVYSSGGPGVTQPSDATWTVRGMGHDSGFASGNSAPTTDYYSEVEKASSKWSTEIFNEGGATKIFLAVAWGVKA